ncbi:MAG: hypothetical protein KBD64_02150 [Gammaproteobacteria bacterium]|nr:hypothetical protein [Gammaproteobacteria bacterium]
MNNLSRYHLKLKNQSCINNKDNSINYQNLQDLQYQIITFYKFVTQAIPEDQLQILRDDIYNILKNFNIKGTVLIASEGINGTISAANLEELNKAFNFLQAQAYIGKILGEKYSEAGFNPFRKLKIKVRPEIVTMGLGKIDVINQTGTHVNAKEWNQLLEDPDAIIIDTRNDFEYKMGTFKNSVNPDTKYFRHLPEYIKNNLNKPEDKNKKIAMFCTGGVRCEKSTAYLKQLGFTKVYQLDGGILNYLKQVDPQENAWEGRCFIFDDRIAVNNNIEPVGIPEDYINYGRRDLMAKDDEY